jgi:hypothetical protein
MTHVDVTPGPATTQAVSPAPDRDVPCPLCGYNLRGLAEPRCPECGYRFEWANLLDPAKRLHPYLFEHHPERNVRSFFRTMLGGLLPRRFWRSLQPAMPSRPRRLVVYWVLASVLGWALVIADASHSFYKAARSNELIRASNVQGAARELIFPRRVESDYDFAAEVRSAGGPQAWVDKNIPTWRTKRFVATWYRGFRVHDTVWPVAIYLAWPWFTLATLLIFRASMRRAKVRTVHVLRCALYSCDAGLWLVPLALFVAAAVTERGETASALPALLSHRYGLPLLFAPIPAAYTAYRLSAAYSLYLRFDRPLATAIAAQFLVLLLVTVVILRLGF